MTHQAIDWSIQISLKSKVSYILDLTLQWANALDHGS